MANLLWKTQGGKTLNLLATPFKTEEEFEKVIFETKEILEDIFLIKRQIRGGSKSGIPDIVGIDNDGNICIVEMKNIPVDVNVIPQVLQYAFWAETNPDSIKSLWLEAEEKPGDISINWEHFEVRIIIIAPTIKRSTLELVDKINYPVDLIEIKRWIEDKNQWLLVNKLELEPDEKKRIKPSTGLPIYDRAFYESEYNKNSVKHFYDYIQQVENLISQKGWPLETKYNKYYCGFKYGFRLAFGIKWVGSKTFAFFFKVPKDISEEIIIPDVPMDKYEDEWKEAVYKIDASKTKVEAFNELFEKSFENITGSK